MCECLCALYFVLPGQRRGVWTGAKGSLSPATQILTLVPYYRILLQQLWVDLTRMFATAAQAQHQVQGGLLLDVVVRQRAAVLELLAWTRGGEG
jgi:hypothetical protein